MNLKNCQIYDISPLIAPETAVFPGDTPFQANFLLDMHKGDNLTLSSVTTTVHIGAHTDAPSHYSPQGQTMAERDLSYYLGPVQVIELARKPHYRISPADLAGIYIECPRVLFKTKSFPDPNRWNDDFMAFSPELIDYLAEKNVILVGLDTPSVDLADDKDLLSHQRVFKHNMAILEGIVLEQVPPGLYDLIALPLKMKNADASPVRAVLVRTEKRG